MGSKLVKFIKNIEEYFLAAFLGIMAIILVLQIFFRYVLQIPLIWSEEIVRFMFIWVTFIGAAYTMKLKGYIRLEIFVNLLPVKVRRFIFILNNLIAIVFFAMIIEPSYRFMMGQSTILATGSRIPMSWVFAAVPVGISILILRLVINTYEMIMQKDASETITDNQSVGR